MNKQIEHLKKARAIRDERMAELGKSWGNLDGRPKGSGTLETKIRQWRADNPEGSKAQANRDLGIDPKTIRKWWEKPKPKTRGRKKGNVDTQSIVKAWREQNPLGTKTECHRATELNPRTIAKWWE